MSTQEQLTQAILAFVNADTWTESKRLVEEQRDLLLTDEADQVFADKLSQSKDDPETIPILQEHRELLKRCRREGSDAAFADLIRPDTTPDISPELMGQLMAMESVQDLHQFIEEHPQLRPMLQQLVEDVNKLPVGHTEQSENSDPNKLIDWSKVTGQVIEAAKKLTLNLLSYVPGSKQISSFLDLYPLLKELQRQTHPSDMPRRVELCRQALALVERDTQPSRWARLQVQLGNSLAQNPLGSQADNLEQAISHYQQALEIYTRQAVPKEWARTMNNLALALYNRIKGERASNIELAISHLQQALEVYTRQAFPEKWAQSCNNLAEAYRGRIRGERAQNIELAIEFLQQALQVYTRQAAPLQWARSMNNLAYAYSGRIRGERAENIELAIEFYEQALSVYTRQAFPVDWARSMNNLAEAYWGRIKGERAQNIELAISFYEQALEVYTRQAAPLQWARSMNNLAAAYSDRIRGERAENLEQAIFHAKQALQVYTRQAFPEGWAQVQNNLAAAYSQRIRGERAENIEQAIHHFQEALNVYTRQAFPQQWAQTMNNLANAYYSRLRGERAENIEQAISYFRQALEVRTRAAFPIEWAQTINNLAAAYYSRIRGERADNYEQAISCYRQALEVYSRHAFPERWAQTLNNLANVYFNRIRGEPSKNLEQAISLYQQALQVLTRTSFPREWARTMNNLANAYSRRVRGERTQNIEQSLDYYQNALTVYTRQAFPTDWATTQHNLANSYSRRIQGERTDNLEQAIHHYRNALTVRTPQALPQECRDTAIELGHLLYDEERFTEARQAFVTAHQALETLHDQVEREIAKRHLSEDNATLYARLVHSSLLEGDESAAFEYAIAGKGRAFVDMLASARFDLEAAGADNPALAADLRQADVLRQQIDNLLTRLTSPLDDGQERNDKQRKHELELLRHLQRQDEQLWEDLAYKYPALTATQSAPALSAQAAQALAAEMSATLVEFVQHAGGWSAFVVTPETVRHLLLNEIDDAFLQKMRKWLNRIENPKSHNKLSYLVLEQWYKAIIRPLQPYLPPNDPLVFAPAGVLHLMPLSIARNPDTKRYLCDEYTVAFAPSLAAMRVILDETKMQNAHNTSGQFVLQNLLSVAYAGKKGSTHYLPNIIPEAKAVASYFPNVTPLYGEAATQQAVIENAPRQQVLHFSCHGSYLDRESPWQSGIELSDGYLSIQHIISELSLSQTRLVTLSACQTGIAALSDGEENVGLVQAMLIAGTQSVVASLWTVNDLSTRILFEQFYSTLAAGESPAKALHQACQFVRQQPGWEHPYYWAAFQVSGLAF